MIRALALAATGDAPLGEAVAACPAGAMVGEPGYHRDLATATRAALTGALAAVPAADRVTAPVVLAVRGPCAAAASRFTARCHDPGHRLRPFESVRLETAELIRGLAGPEWAGACYLLASPDHDGYQAILAATVLRRRHLAALAGELLLTGDDGEAGLAVVAAVHPVPPPDAVRPGPAGSVLLGLAARTPVQVPA